ncbi:MAG: protoporphyrinogen oxidase [Bryobacteraceae bacterium]
MPRVIIIGGGVSGLSAAYYLSKAGVRPVLIEQRPRLGGVVSTEHVEGCVVEAGPDSFLSVKPAALELVRELGLGGEIIGSNDHLRKTYVKRRNRLVPLPDGLMMMVPTKVMPLAASPLLGWGTKIRMGLEWFRRPRPAAADESVAEFVCDHYGKEAVDYLAEPLLSGVYGGDPEQLSIQAVLPRFAELADRYGSLTKGVLHERRAARRAAAGAPLFRTLKGGLGQLVDATVKASRFDWVRARAEAVERTQAGFRVRVGPDWMEAEHLVLACEAHNAALLAPDARIGELLAAVPYTSSMTVAVGFDETAFPHPLKGFGFLVPKRERRRLMAATWVGTKFPFRTPPGTAMVRCFLHEWDAGDDAVIAAVLDELGEIVPFHGRPRFTRLYRWPRSMAQYTVGHLRRTAELEARAAEIPGLHLAGNAYHGIGVPDCIRMGKQAAEAIRTAAPTRHLK